MVYIKCDDYLYIVLVDSSSKILICGHMSMQKVFFIMEHYFKEKKKIEERQDLLFEPKVKNMGEKIITIRCKFHIFCD